MLSCVHYFTLVSSKLPILFSFLALEYSEILIQFFAFILIRATQVYFM